MSVGAMTDVGRQAVILLVEDNSAEVLLMQEAFSHAQVPNRIIVANRGEKALALLKDAVADGGQELLPDIILLDLNLPGMDGHALLRTIKEDPKMRHIPVIVMSNTISTENLSKIYGEHANCCITKPASLEKFDELVSVLESFWFDTVVLSRNAHTI